MKSLLFGTSAMTLGKIGKVTHELILEFVKILHFGVFPTLGGVLLRTPTTSHETALVNHSTIESNCLCVQVSLVAEILGCGQVIAHHGVSTGIDDCSRNGFFIVHRLDGRTHASVHALQIGIKCLDLDGLEGDESSLSSSLITEVLNTFLSCLLIVHNDGIEVSSENRTDCFSVLLLLRSAEVTDSTLDARKDALQG